MKSKIILLLILVGICLSFSLPTNPEIGKCFISFKDAVGLTVSGTTRLPDRKDKFWTLQTDSGDVKVTCIDGYRVLYNNDKNAIFVNLKVELSDSRFYGKDTINLLENIEYLNSHSKDMETQEVIKLSYNGYTIYGLSRSNIDEGYNLGTFVMFPGNNIIVYFYFQNIKPEYRQFKDLTDYKEQRNGLLGAYTFYLRRCVSK